MRGRKALLRQNDGAFEHVVEFRARQAFHLGEPPLYRVLSNDHGCYALHQLRPFPDATFGLDALRSGHDRL